MDKKWLILIGLFIVLPISINALTITPDSNGCNNIGYCESIVDISKYLNASSITSIKALNLTSSLPPTSAVSITNNIIQINYKFNGTNLTVYGYIKNGTSTYWTMNIGGYTILDPYWNSSNALTSTASTGSWGGIRITITNGTTNLIRVSEGGLCTCNNVTVMRFGDNVTMGSTTTKGSDTWFNFTPALTLANGTDYYIACGKSDWSSGTLCYKSPYSETLPYQTELFQLIHYVTIGDDGKKGFNWVQEPRAEAYSINGTETSIPASTSISLWLNNSQANFSGTYPTALNTTASINTTGLFVELYDNETLMNNATNTALNISVRKAGFHNITANYGGNGTFNSAKTTWYATITQGTGNINITLNTSSTVTQGAYVNISCNGTPTANLYNSTNQMTNPFILNTTSLSGNYIYTCNNTDIVNYTLSTDTKTLTVNIPTTATSNTSIVYDIAQLKPNNQYCTSNTTLFQTFTEANVNRSIICPNGCDNVTLSCAWLPYQNDLAEFFIIIIILWLIYWFVIK